MTPTFFSGFTRDLHQPLLWKTFYNAARTKNPSLSPTIPPLPTIDGEALFWEMMRASRDPDPWMYPALQALKKSGKYILAGLSNTMIFPVGHEYRAHANDGVRGIFDVFVSSAHVGMRKPDAVIYEYAVRELDAYARAHPEKGAPNGVTAGDILFLDDIGENLKAAKKAGFRTVKVNLGKAFEAVDQLEEVTGLELAGDHPRIAVVPRIGKPKL